MTSCSYCDQPATMMIVSNPEPVCLVHGLEFWTGLLGYARDRRQDYCVKDERLCSCQSCQELDAPYVRAAAIAAAGLSPLDHEGFRIRLAS
jgi:hypothetical protein